MSEEVVGRKGGRIREDEKKNSSNHLISWL